MTKAPPQEMTRDHLQYGQSNQQPDVYERLYMVILQSAITRLGTPTTPTSARNMLANVKLMADESLLALRDAKVENSKVIRDREELERKVRETPVAQAEPGNYDPHNLDI